MSTRTATPAESWHDLVTHCVWVRRRMVNRRVRYLASVYVAPYRIGAPGRTVFGDYPTPAEAVEAAKLLLICDQSEGGTVCNWRDVEKVRAELAKGRQ